MYDLGDVAHLTITVTDSAGTLVDSTVALTLTLPDQTTTGPFTPTHDSLGKYHYDYTTTQAGRHVARWAGTSVTFAHTEVFDVETIDISLVSLTDAKNQLDKTTTADDDEIRSYILAASENIEISCGVCAPRTFTERCTSRSYGLTLSKVPVLSVTSLTPVFAGTPGLNVSDLDVDKNAGVLAQFNNNTFYGAYDVTYTAGRAVIPSSLRRACLIIVAHLWETQRGMSSNPRYGGAEDMVTLPGWGFAVPNRAAELIAGFPNAPGFA